MKIKISIGTRAYNAEKTIAQTLESVLKQSMNDFEYWIADNGSTDRTREIIDQYAAKDQRIHVIHIEKNSPEFSSIKMLIEHGKGEFFMLLDSDDWLEVDFMHELYTNAMKYNVDVAVGGSKFHFVENGAVGFRQSNIEVAFPIKQMPELFSFIHQFFRPVWGKIFSADLVRKRWEPMQAERPEWLNYGGDTFTCFELLKEANGIYLSNKVLHNYRVHRESFSYIFSFDRFNSDVFLLEHAKEYLRLFGSVDEKNLRFVYIVYFNAVIDTVKVLFSSSNISEKNKLEYLEKIFNNYHTKYLFEKKYLDDEMFKQIWQIVNCIGALNIEEYDIILNRIYMDILSVNSILNQCVKRPKFVKTYNQIVQLILVDKYQDVHELIINELANEGVSSEEYRIDLLNLMIMISALIEDQEAFVLAHKLMANEYIQRKETDLAKKIIRELEEMVPGDLDIVALNDKINLI